MTASSARPRDNWADAELYQAYVGRWSTLVAREFVGWLGVPDGARWLDVGCGPGTLAQVVLEACAPSVVVGVDPSPAFLETARRRISDPRASFTQGSAAQLPAGIDPFDAVVSGLVLNFVPDASAALAAAAAAVVPTGIVGAYVWDYGSGMQLMRHFWDAATELDPAVLEHDEGRRFPDFGNIHLPRLFAEHLVDVSTTAIVIDTRFASFDDYWGPFLGGQGPAPGYAVSLDEDSRGRLREAVRARLPIAQDGSIALTARAWAVKGTRPAAEVPASPNR